MERQLILLNPGPANTSDTVKQAMTRPDICPREPIFGELMRGVCEGLTRVVHPEGSRYYAVLFAGSGTAAVEATICSTVPDDGRLLVIENGAYGERIHEMALAYRIPHDVERFGVGGYPDLQRIEELLREPRYTHLAVIHHETSTGMLNPVAEIGALCRQNGVQLIVDAMSSYAGLPIDVEQLGADWLISSANKCIQGMAGVSFVIGRRELLDALRPLPGRSLYLNLALQHQHFAATGQMRYTPPVQVLYALEQALTEYFREGGAARHQRYLNNWIVLDGGMRAMGFRRLLPEKMLSRILTAYLEPEHPHYSFERMHDRLLEQGFVIYPGKGAQQNTFRLANMGAVDAEDMRSFLRALKLTVDEMGWRPLYRS
jgi:2-aminoethylphosphonate aminotransferase